MSVKKCTQGKRHKWAFVENVKRTRETLRYIEVKVCGLYRCNCGARKYGMARLDMGES